jgi:predicted DCC family thiol-disulfide oxidoreductase YuxK
MNSSKVKILFDGNCIVWDTEMMHYHRIAPDLFEMVDISSESFNASLYGLDSKDVNEKMHLFTADGKLLVGVDAFSHIWQLIPRYQLAAKLVNLPLINSCAWIGYRIFARYRHLLPKKVR